MAQASVISVAGKSTADCSSFSAVFCTAAATVWEDFHFVKILLHVVSVFNKRESECSKQSFVKVDFSCAAIIERPFQSAVLVDGNSSITRPISHTVLSAM